MSDPNTTRAPLGSVHDIVDSGGTVVNHLTYNAFGEITEETDGTVDHIFGFAGNERDEESDLEFDGIGYTDASVGRWISENPMGFLVGVTNLATIQANGVLLNGVDHMGEGVSANGLDDLANGILASGLVDLAGGMLPNGILANGLDQIGHSGGAEFLVEEELELEEHWDHDPPDLDGEGNDTVRDVPTVDKGGKTFHKLARNFRESSIGRPLEASEIHGTC